MQAAFDRKLTLWHAAVAERQRRGFSVERQGGMRCHDQYQSSVCVGVNYHKPSIAHRIECCAYSHAPQLPFWASFRVGANWRTGLARSERHCGGAGPLCLRWLAPVTYQVRAARLEPARRRPSVNLLVLDSHGRLRKGASELVRDEHVGRCASRARTPPSRHVTYHGLAEPSTSPPASQRL